MKRQKRNKLKDLLSGVPLGYLVDSAVLSRHEIDHRLVHKYIQSGWLKSVARGLYQRPFLSGNANTELDWQTVMLSMMMMQYPVHVGGMFALGLQGFQHYLPVGEAPHINLFGDDVPTWLQRIETTSAFLVKTLALFHDKEMGVSEVSLPEPEVNLLSNSPSNSSMMRVSHPERAILEALNDLPKNETFHNIDMVFESLTNLRPARLQSLLASCRSVKVKRLFFLFADRHGHAWRAYLSPDDFDLGSGARSLGNGGKFHPVYNISVPGEFLQTLEQERVDGP